MDTVTTIQNYLQGKKTYLVAISGIIGVIILFADGQMQLIPAITRAIELILAITIRAGIASK